MPSFRIRRRLLALVHPVVPQHARHPQPVVREDGSAAGGLHAAVRRWRNVQKHREAQAKGRAGVFSSYRLRVCSVLRDYTLKERDQAPPDSLSFHSKAHG